MTKADDIGIVHFSGDVKLWHIVLDSVDKDSQRRSVEHWWQTGCTVEEFSEKLIGYRRWCLMADAGEDYAHYGCVVLIDDDGSRRLVVRPRERDEGSEDVTVLARGIFEDLRVVVQKATRAWKFCADALLETCPPALRRELVRPSAPAGSIAPGQHVKVSWPPEAVPDANTMWFSGTVVSVHADGRHVVRYDRGGDWGDTERGVVAERIEPEVLAARKQ